MARDLAKKQQRHEGERHTAKQRPNEQGDYGSPQGGAGDSQSQNRGSAGIGGEERKPHGGQGQYDSEQGKSDSQQHAQGHYSGPGKTDPIGPSRGHEQRWGQESVERIDGDARFDTTDPEATDISSRSRIGASGGRTKHQ
jgi:hypothetical protein